MRSMRSMRGGFISRSRGPLQQVCHGPARVLGHDCLPGPQTGILVAKSHVSDRHGHCLLEMTSSFLLKQSKYSRYVENIRDLALWIVIRVKAREPRSMSQSQRAHMKRRFCDVTDVPN
jgi:hypothetical protein